MIDQHVRILIVEDSMNDAALLQRQLKKVFPSSQIEISTTLQNTRHASKTFVPELVFTDYNLGDFTGEDVILNIRDIYPEVPIIIITGTLNNEEVAANTILQGASAYFTKSDINNLHKRLEPVLVKILKDKERYFKKIKGEREQRENLERVHSLLKKAAEAEKNHDDNQVEYYKKLISDLKENLETFIK